MKKEELHKIFAKAFDTINEINNERLRLRKALEFYANDTVYEPTLEEGLWPIEMDIGAIAKQALAPERKWKENGNTD